ncbi:TadE/TadG family type IV pilus assembly protein [Futiania mangrovi]|uniref:Pilus assembly protein n=1 Tax=Futiania mangrovi TaxID=2959716 RepID=A0A9J6PGB5_9PROT|nr:TadE/TadG family type IV pilus assembly protein [Futiania mangrovii]MCP1336864.1 pilus assembly protein [Futiania mangrovii]
MRTDVPAPEPEAPPRRARRLRVCLLPRRFRRNEDGAVAIEFAFLALPFFYLLMAILETSLVFFAEINLNAGMEQAVRQIRTGNFTGSQAELVAEVCGGSTVIPKCTEKVKVDVRRIDAFSDATGTDAFEPCRSGVDPDAFGVDVGAASTVMLARVCYDWELFTPFMSKLLEFPTGSGSRLMAATGAFRNEPFN